MATTKVFIVEGGSETFETHGVEGVFMDDEAAVEAATKIIKSNVSLDFVRVVVAPVGGGASEAVVFWARRVCPPINKGGYVARKDREITFNDKRNDYRGSIREEN